MKLIIHGPLAGYGPDGTIHSWAPDTEVEVDDKDAKAVAWARSWVDMGATLIEDAPAKESSKESSKEPAKEPTRQTASPAKTSK